MMKNLFTSVLIILSNIAISQNGVTIYPVEKKVNLKLDSYKIPLNIIGDYVYMINRYDYNISYFNNYIEKLNYKTGVVEKKLELKKIKELEFLEIVKISVSNDSVFFYCKGQVSKDKYQYFSFVYDINGQLLKSSEKYYDLDNKKFKKEGPVYSLLSKDRNRELLLKDTPNKRRDAETFQLSLVEVSRDEVLYSLDFSLPFKEKEFVLKGMEFVNEHTAFIAALILRNGKLKMDFLEWHFIRYDFKNNSMDTLTLKTNKPLRSFDYDVDGNNFYLTTHNLTKVDDLERREATGISVYKVNFRNKISFIGKSILFNESTVPIFKDISKDLKYLDMSFIKCLENKIYIQFHQNINLNVSSNKRIEGTGFVFILDSNLIINLSNTILHKYSLKEYSYQYAGSFNLLGTNTLFTNNQVINIFNNSFESYSLNSISDKVDPSELNDNGVTQILVYDFTTNMFRNSLLLAHENFGGTIVSVPYYFKETNKCFVFYYSEMVKNFSGLGRTSSGIIDLDSFITK